MAGRARWPQGSTGAARRAPRRCEGPLLSHRRPSNTHPLRLQLRAARGEPEFPILRSNAALQEQWPETPDSPPLCVGRGAPAPPPAVSFPERLHTLPPSTALLPKWRPTASFPACRRSPDRAWPRPRMAPPPWRRPNSRRDCAARRHALGARAARGAREAALGGARRPAATYAGLSRGGPGCACAPGLRAARGQTGGRWDAREARGPAREPPGAGKTRLLLPLPPPLPSYPALSRPFLIHQPLPLLKSNSFLCFFFRGAQLPFERRSRRGERPPPRVTHAPSAPQQLRAPLHPRSPFPLGEDSPQRPLARCTPFSFLPRPPGPNCPLAAPQLAPRALPDLRTFCISALHLPSAFPGPGAKNPLSSPKSPL